MKTKIQIKSVIGSLLFEYECENNSIRKTLEEAIKSYADLRYANLRSADLSSADLRYANLRSADLRFANLSFANLRSADLRFANLSFANLSYADLSFADLRSADLRSADLSFANLRYADLSFADLRFADLRSADLSFAKNSELIIAMTRILPEGDIIGYKKAYRNGNSTIIKLLIPKEAKRSSAFGRKCRAEFADVLEIDGNDKAHSGEDKNFIYEIGKRVIPTKPFDENWIEECSTGIHFFITRIEAENY